MMIEFSINLRGRSDVLHIPWDSIWEVLQLVMLLHLWNPWIIGIKPIKHGFINYIQRLLWLVERTYRCSLAPRGLLERVFASAFHKLPTRLVIRQLWNEYIAEAIVEVVRLLLLPEHDCVCWCREEDLLNEHIGSVWKECHKWENQKHNPGLAWLEHEEVLAVDLGLENFRDGRRVAANHANIIEKETGNVHDPCKPIPVNGFDEEFADYDVHDKWESHAAREPMRLCFAIRVRRSWQSL